MRVAGLTAGNRKKWTLKNARSIVPLFLALSLAIVCMLPSSRQCAAQAQVPVAPPSESAAVSQPSDSASSSRQSKADSEGALGSIMPWLVALVAGVFVCMATLLGFALRLNERIARQMRDLGRHSADDALRQIGQAAVDARNRTHEIDTALDRIRSLESEVAIALWVTKASAWISQAGFFKDGHPLRDLYFHLAEEALNYALAESPDNGTARIWKAWLRKRLGFVSEALALVEAALLDKSLHEHELARARYNAACYSAILAKDSPAMRARAIEHLKDAIEGHEIFRELARGDSDFDRVRDNKAFADLIA